MSAPHTGCVGVLLYLVHSMLEEPEESDPEWCGAIEGVLASIAQIDPMDRESDGLVSFDWLVKRGALRYTSWRIAREQAGAEL